MRPKRLLWLIPVLILYGIGYAAFVNTHEPSISETGVFVFRSSFPKFSGWGARLEGITWLFPKAGLANWVFLPIDQCWRSARGLPASTIDNDEFDWQGYFNYLIAIGRMKRGHPTAEQAGSGQPATRPESKSEDGDKPQPEAKGRSR